MARPSPALAPEDVHMRRVLLHLRAIRRTSRAVDCTRNSFRRYPGQLEMPRLRHRKVHVSAARPDAARAERPLKTRVADAPTATNARRPSIARGRQWLDDVVSGRVTTVAEL